MESEPCHSGHAEVAAAAIRVLHDYVVEEAVDWIGVYDLSGLSLYVVEVWGVHAEEPPAIFVHGRASDDSSISAYLQPIPVGARGVFVPHYCDVDRASMVSPRRLRLLARDGWTTPTFVG